MNKLATMIAIGLTLGVLASPPVLASPMLVRAAVQAQDPAPVDLNRATAEELEKVPGIGPSTAARIVEWREAQGRFERLEDLLNIRGIGVKTLEKLRPFLTVSAKDEGRDAGV